MAYVVNPATRFAPKDIASMARSYQGSLDVVDPMLAKRSERSLNPQMAQQIIEASIPRLSKSVALVLRKIQARYAKLTANYVASDAGKSKSQHGSHERRDCTVRAVAHAFNFSYEEAHERLRKMGRRDGKGFYSHIIASGFGMDRLTQFNGKTVAQVLKSIPAGRYYVQINRHAFAIVDGKIHDTILASPRTRVHGVWQAWDTNPVTDYQI